MHVSYGTHARENTGYSGKSGRFHVLCPEEFMPVGQKCVKTPIKAEAIFEDAAKECAGENGEIYKPSNPLQEIIMKAYMEMKGIEQMWINVMRVEGKWIVGGKKELTSYQSNWAPYQPSQDGDCVYMSANQNYKWVVGNCEQLSKPFFCELREPYCPAGYTWVPTTLNSCFKRYPMSGQFITSEISANKICARDKTRLAVIRTENEKAGILNWADNDKPPDQIRTYYLGMKQYEDTIMLSNR